jgi:nicotinamide riboside kinase
LIEQLLTLKKEIKKIVVIGPEGTGKSTLCEELAAHYQTMWCQEFAREYLLTHGLSYTYDDLLLIAKEQVALEEEYLKAMDNGQWAIGNQQPPLDDQQSAIHHSPFTIHNPILFIDTDMYVMKVWAEFVFNKCHRFILDTIVERHYDLYLLCDTDLPWVKDELREYPDLATRRRLYNIYEDLMINQSVPWVRISGKSDERLKKAIAATDFLLKGEVSLLRG